MAQANPEKTQEYKAPGKVWFNDGREVELLRYIYNKPNLDKLRNNPAGVLDAIDDFTREKDFLMNIGAPKAAVVCKYIAELKPSTVLELGGYVGYSAIVFGDAVKRAGGKRFISLERDPLFAAVARSLVDLAGLADVVKVVVGRSNDILRPMKQSGEIESLDMLFMDHWKLLYRQDLKLCEELGLVRKGTLVCADNYTATGNPLFSEYLHSSVEEKRRVIKEGPPPGESEKIKETFGPGGDDLNLDLKGNPELLYEILEIVNVVEPDGRPDGVAVARAT